MSKPTIAIVGRPNVGKSTLFNRLIGGRDAIVSDQAGTTRDRHFGDGVWNGREFWLVDTGGLVPDSDETMDKAIRAQVETAVDEAQLVVLLVDGKDGVNPIDAEIARRLRQSGRPVLLAVNKLDDLRDHDARHVFHELGIGEPWPVSATSGKGTGDLLDEMVKQLPVLDEAEDPDTIRVAVIGRPNAGKSSLVNRLLGEERLVVTPIAGTTRDAIDTTFNYHGRVMTFVDTAGLRRKAKVDGSLEFYSTIRTERAIDRADVCVLVVDAPRGLHNQDLRIATRAWERGAGLVIVVNKWDLIEDKDANTAIRGQKLLIEKAPFLEHVPFVYASALTGQRARNVLDVIVEVHTAREMRIGTSQVNDVLQELLARNAPPQQAGEAVKLLYCTQINTKPPEFAIVTNRPDDIPESYRRFLVRGFRNAWNFTGVPIRLKLNRRGSRS